jgi:hypothetical protein
MAGDPVAGDSVAGEPVRGAPVRGDFAGDAACPACATRFRIAGDACAATSEELVP